MLQKCASEREKCNKSEKLKKQSAGRCELEFNNKPKLEFSSEWKKNMQRFSHMHM